MILNLFIYLFFFNSGFKMSWCDSPKTSYWNESINNSY